MNQAVRRPQLVLAVVATAAFFLSVDLTFVNVALPDIGRRFQASAPDLAWVVDGYTVALTSLLIPGAAVAERIGRKTVFLCGMALFTAASLAGGLTDGLRLLLAARVVMGAGAGMMLAPAMAITAMSFAPPTGRARWRRGRRPVRWGWRSARCWAAWWSARWAGDGHSYFPCRSWRPLWPPA